jgi:hypothetical protein
VEDVQEELFGSCASLVRLQKKALVQENLGRSVVRMGVKYCFGAERPIMRVCELNTRRCEFGLLEISGRRTLSCFSLSRIKREFETTKFWRDQIL